MENFPPDRGTTFVSTHVGALAFSIKPLEDSNRMLLSRSVLASSILVPTLILAAPNTPQAPQKPHEVTEVSRTRNDPFFWLREKDNPEVLKYLETENRYTDNALKHIEKLQVRLYDEMRGRIKESDVSVPEKIDDYYYYSRTETGKQYSITCRKKGSMNAKKEVVHDKNELHQAQKSFRIRTLSVSQDHLLAYSTAHGLAKSTPFGSNLWTGALPDD
jgi:oligopeptidase B